MLKKITLVVLLGLMSLSAPSYEMESLLLISNEDLPATYFDSNRFTHEETLVDVDENPYLVDAELTLVAENDQITLYVDQTNMSIYVLQKETGYVWSSTVFMDYAAMDDQDQPLYPELYQEGDRGLRSTLWRNRVTSPVWLSYYGGSADSPQFKDETIWDGSLSRMDYIEQSDGFDLDIYFGISRIGFVLNVRLLEDGISYAVDQDSIVEHSTNKLAEISIYPFFGAAKKDMIPGYFMIPDGIGALIRFDDNPAFNAIFEKSFYNKDFAIDQSVAYDPFVTDDQDFTANAYGMVHGVNEQGYLTIINQGASYASLTMYPGGVVTDFNYAFTTFTFRSSYRQPLNQSQTNSILKVQEDMNPVDLYQTVHFLSNDDANYVGMANTYQEYLIDRGDLDQNDLNGDVSLHLDVLLSESKKAFIGRSTIVMTSISDVTDMATKLLASGVKHLSITLRGTSSAGYSGTSLDEWPLGKHVGTTSDYQTLLNLDDVDVYLYVDPVKAYLYTRNARLYDASVGRHLLTYRFSDHFGVYDMIHPEEFIPVVQGYQEKAIDFGFSGVLYDTLGYTTYSSFGDRIFTRFDMKEAIQTLVDQQAVLKPNDYAFNASALFNVIADHSGHAKMTDTVPFLTYALSGYKDVFSRYYNFFGNMQTEILRMIDFHLFPSYIVTKESAYALLDTPSYDLYTTSFDLWFDTIQSSYSQVDDALSSVYQSHVVSRTIISTGISEITYANGVTLVINYLSDSFNYQTYVLPAHSVTTIGGSL